MNELDPLGVSDVVDDEYAGLNFKIYSQLLVDRDQNKLRNSIQIMLNDYYGVTVTDDDLNETIKKLQSLPIEKFKGK